MEKSNYQEIEKMLSDFKNRAQIVGYKNQLPRMPKNKSSDFINVEHLMVGFYKRLVNWENGLIQLENPGGILRESKKIIENNINSNFDMSKFNISDEMSSKN